MRIKFLEYEFLFKRWFLYLENRPLRNCPLRFCFIFIFFFSPQWHVHSLAAYISGVSKRGLQTFDFDFFYNFVDQSSYFRGNLFSLTTIKHFFFPGPFMNRANFKYGISQSVIQIKHQVRWNNWFKKRLTFKGFLFHFVLNHNSIDKDATILKI